MKRENLRNRTGMLLLLACVSFLFTGCDQGETLGGASSDALIENAGESGEESEAAASMITCEFTEEYMRIIEPYASSVAYSGNVSQAEVEGHTYQLASDIAQEDCLSFVQAQETLCAFLEENGISTDGMTYCVLSDYTNWTASGDTTAYFDLETMESWEQVLTTIQVSLGDYTNYGYLYALANDVAGELGWEMDTGVSENVGVDLFREDPYLLNLVYPCFDLMYEDEKTIQTCKALALKIFQKLENPYVGEEAFLEEIKAWAQEQGIDFTPTYLQFAYYSESCPLKITTRYLEVFRQESFVADAYYTEGLITEDYFSRASTIIFTFENLDELLTTLCEIFGMYPEGRIETRLMGSLSSGGRESQVGGLFSNDYCYIRAISVTVLAHEYTHYLYYLSCELSDPDYSNMYNEVVAYYYGSVLNSYIYGLLYNENIDSTYLSRMEEKLGETYDEPADYIRLIRILAREVDPQYLSNWGGTDADSAHSLKIAFGEYFVRTYGEEVFLNSMMYPSRIEEYTGKMMKEIFVDWEVDMADPEIDALISYPD